MTHDEKRLKKSMPEDKLEQFHNTIKNYNWKNNKLENIQDYNY